MSNPRGRSHGDSRGGGRGRGGPTSRGRGDRGDGQGRGPPRQQAEELTEYQIRGQPRPQQQAQQQTPSRQQQQPQRQQQTPTQAQSPWGNRPGTSQQQQPQCQQQTPTQAQSPWGNRPGTSQQQQPQCQQQTPTQAQSPWGNRPGTSQQQQPQCQQQTPTQAQSPWGNRPGTSQQQQQQQQRQQPTPSTTPQAPRTQAPRPAWGNVPPQPDVSAETVSSMSSELGAMSIAAQRELNPAPSSSVLESAPESEFMRAEVPRELLSPDETKTKFLSHEFPAKPKQRGDLGRPIKLRTNHYQLAVRKPFSVHQYDVELTKVFPVKNQEEKTIKNKEIMRAMFLKLCQKLPAEYNNKIVYNFSKNLYSLKQLPFEDSITYDLDIEGGKYILQIKKINVVSVDPSNYSDPVSIQVLDLIFTQNFNYSCVNVNRSFFKEGDDFFALGFGLELWKGAYASVRPSEVGLTWNIDSANAAFLTSRNVLELAIGLYKCDGNRLKDKINNDFKLINNQMVIGYKFLEQFKGRDIKTETGNFRKKIQGFGPDAFHKFDWNKDNKTVKVTIKDYIKQQYKIDLKHPYLPCIDLGKGSYLPMELCKTELKNKKKLSDKETADMIKRTAVPALDRLNYIQNWVSNSKIQQDPVLKEYNIDINLRLMEIDGIVLQAPDVQYKEPNVAMSRNIAEKGSWDHRNFKFNSCISIKRWVVFNFANRCRDDAAYQFIDKFIQVGRIHGIAIEEPLDYVYNNRITGQEDVRRLFQDMITKHKNIELILMIMSGTTQTYNFVKTLGDLQFGIITQGVKETNVDDPTVSNKIDDRTVSNILLKVNTKLGGKNFILSPKNQLFSQHLQHLYQGPMMVFGADVTHPSPGDTNETESIAAVVGSLDKDCCYYAARLYAQSTPKGQAYEMIHDLDKMVISLLQENFNRNKGYPKKIVFYRDGVSEGQFRLVIRHEMNKIRTACQQINAAYKPAITFVVVQKRHHTRLFPVEPKDQNGKAKNVPPGTVVDNAIVTPSLFDFFLCSHVGIQGTSRPCRYFVLHDDNNFTMNQIQLLSHYLCHVYARCPRSVSYPAPAYYAHLAAFRGRDYIRPPRQQSGTVVSYEIELHPNTRNKMFFS